MIFRNNDPKKKDTIAHIPEVNIFIISMKYINMIKMIQKLLLLRNIIVVFILHNENIFFKNVMNYGTS